MNYAETLVDLAIYTADEGVVLLPTTEASDNGISNSTEYGIWGEEGSTTVGSITLRPLGDELIDISCDVDSQYRGRGYATLAIRAIADYARDSLKKKTQANVGFDNPASQRAVTKAGFEISDTIGNLIIYTDPTGL